MTSPRSAQTSLDLSSEKLLEVDYFNTLISYVCTQHVGITPLPGYQELDIFPGGSRPHRARPIEGQLSYLFSAFLNAAYSVVEYLKREPLFRDACQQFIQKHKYFYGSGPNGGLRTRATHFAHQTPRFKGRLIPATPDKIGRLFTMLRRMKVPITTAPDPNPERSKLYYLNDSEPQDDINKVAGEHYFDLSNLIRKCKAISG